MKKLLLSLATLLCITGASHLAAQNNASVELTQKPTALPEATKDIPLTGVSPTGKYAFGTFSHNSFLVHLADMKIIDLSKDGSGVDILKVLDDGTALFTRGMGDPLTGYVRNADGTEWEIVPFDENYNSITPRDITLDKKYIIGNAMNEKFRIVPFIGTKKEDGTYKIEQLPTLEKDAMGAKAQYSQVFYISQDGKRIMGRQNGNSGNDWRILQWDRNEDGTYTCSAPSDKYFYNLDAPMPGEMPQWEKYVTVDYDDPKYPEQEEAFNKAFEAWQQAYDKRINKDCSIDGYWIFKNATDDLMTLFLKPKDEKSEGIPALYNPNDNTLVQLTDAEGYKLVCCLMDGAYLIMNEGSPYFKAHVLQADKTIIPLTEWIQKISGYDAASFYTSGIVGVPRVSADGKTIAVSVFNGTNEESSYFTFSKSITTTPLAAPMVEKANNALPVTFANGSIYAMPNSTIELFNIAGERVLSTKMCADGCWNTQLPQTNATYIVRVTYNNQQNSLKFIW